MPKVGMEKIRRRQLIDATIASIHQDGFGSTTISRVSGRAGLSSGIVAHYFHDKAGLLEATMRSLVEDLRREVVRRLARAKTPLARVLAIVDANFDTTQFAPEVISAWLSFWAQVPHVPGLARIQRVYQRRLLSNLRHAFKGLLPAAQAEQMAHGLAALIDGLWLNGVLADGPMRAAEARAIARAYVSDRLGGPRRAGNGRDRAS